MIWAMHGPLGWPRAPLLPSPRRMEVQVRSIRDPGQPGAIEVASVDPCPLLRVYDQGEQWDARVDVLERWSDWIAEVTA